LLKSTGIPSNEDIYKVIPPKNRLEKGPVAIIECFQEIPCNPCSTHCPKNAICDMSNIIEIPKLDYDKCNGCGICATACPGLAIFVVDVSYSLDKALVKIPYEFLPEPLEGDIVLALNREGNPIGKCEIIKINRFKNNEKTPLLTLMVDKEIAMDVRNIRRE
jgi:Fe-S-cluster-containing hydrogenase component 2